jgi:hypothetical protein
MILINLGTKSFLFKNVVLSRSHNTFNGEFKMQNKKDKRAKADVKSTVADAGKTVSGSADAKTGVADSGKKGAHGTTGGKKGWKK